MVEGGRGVDNESGMVAYRMTYPKDGLCLVPLQWHQPAPSYPKYPLDGNNRKLASWSASWKDRAAVRRHRGGIASSGNACYCCLEIPARGERSFCSRASADAAGVCCAAGHLELVRCATLNKLNV